MRRVYVRATADATERNLRERLRGKYPDLPPDLGLVETVRPCATAKRVRRASRP